MLQSDPDVLVHFVRIQGTQHGGQGQVGLQVMFYCLHVQLSVEVGVEMVLMLMLILMIILGMLMILVMIPGRILPPQIPDVFPQIIIQQRHSEEVHVWKKNTFVVVNNLDKKLWYQNTRMADKD